HHDDLKRGPCLVHHRGQGALDRRRAVVNRDHDGNEVVRRAWRASKVALRARGRLIVQSGRSAVRCVLRPTRQIHLIDTPNTNTYPWITHAPRRLAGHAARSLSFANECHAKEKLAVGLAKRPRFVHSTRSRRATYAEDFTLPPDACSALAV